MKNIRELIRTVIREESEYQTFFKKALEKTGKSIPEMSDEEKKAFFNKIDAAWSAKGEKKNEINEANNENINFLIDQLVNSMEHYNASEFVSHIGKETGFDKNILRKIFKGYWKLDSRLRSESDSDYWKYWLRTMGLKF